MIKIVVARLTVDGVITKGREYEVHSECPGLVAVNCDYGAKLWLSSSNFMSKHMADAQKTAAEAEGLAKTMAERKRVRDNVASAINNAEWIGTITATSEPNVEALEKLREVLRVPEGENIVTHAKVIRALADALIGLQK